MDMDRAYSYGRAHACGLIVEIFDAGYTNDDLRAQAEANDAQKRERCQAYARYARAIDRDDDAEFLWWQFQRGVDSQIDFELKACRRGDYF